jgi:hypothetical protein
VERQTTSSGFAFFPPLFGIKLAHKPLAERQQNAVGYSPSFSLLQFKAVKDRLVVRAGISSSHFKTAWWIKDFFHTLFFFATSYESF